MSTTELDHLTKMINQIADNIAIGEDDLTTASRVVDHVNRFWARSMQLKVIEYANFDGARLNPVAKLTISSLNTLEA